MKNTLIFILEPSVAVRAIILSAVGPMGEVVGFSSEEALEMGLQDYPVPDIILIPAYSQEQLPPLFVASVRLICYSKPFNPIELANELQQAINRETIERRVRHQVARNSQSPVRPYHAKRVFDCIAAAVLLVLLAPLLLVISVGIWLESGGPVFYTSKRAGRGYRVFDFYKFRTMQREVAGLPFFKIHRDERVTSFGQWLRRTSLDELPQLWNVLKGDMSIVGNRPLPLYEAEILTTDEWAPRFMAPAGITGLWQVKRGKKPGMSVIERLQLDIAYANRMSFISDVLILLQTPAAMWQPAPKVILPSEPVREGLRDPRPTTALPTFSALHSPL